MLQRPLTLEHHTTSGVVDDYGNPIMATTTTTVLGYLEQTERSEATNDRDVSSESALLVVAAGTALVATDVIVADGVRWQIDGPAWSTRQPYTNVEHHLEARLRRAD